MGGTVPTYQAFIDSFKRKGGGGAYFAEDELFDVVEKHLRDGVAFMTIHAAVTRELAIKALKSGRVIPSSLGGVGGTCSLAGCSIIMLRTHSTPGGTMCLSSLRSTTPSSQ